MTAQPASMISPNGAIAEMLAALLGASLETIKDRVKIEKRMAETIAKSAAKAGNRAAADPMFDYAQGLRCLLYWLTRGKRPRNCDAFASFRPLTESLVARGAIPAALLTEFE